MNITIAEESPLPVYRQIVIQVIMGVIKKQISRNTTLPAIRQLASDLSLTNATVAKAYQILEQNKIITTAGRRGTFIHESAEENAARYRSEELRSQLKDFISLQLKCGVSMEEIQQSIQTVINEFRERGR